jgi:type VI secretion system protein ImpE
MTPNELYEAGKLGEAIEALSQELRKHSLETGSRVFLAELLCVVGELERADTQLDLLVDQTPENAVGIAQFRQLIRAEQARRQFFEESRLPELVEPPSDLLKLYLKASVSLLDGDADEARRLLEQAENERPQPKGTWNGADFDDLRDLDDLTAGVLEVLTCTGKYYWIPLDRVSRLQFVPPACPRDLLWREARLDSAGGLEGQVFVPAIYHTTAVADETVRLGRRTDWTGSEGGPVRGLGQRMFLVGGEALGVMTLEELVIDTDKHPG